MIDEEVKIDVVPKANMVMSGFELKCKRPQIL